MVFRLNVGEEGQQHIRELIQHNQNKTFGCANAYIVFSNQKENLPEMKQPYTIEINIQDPSLKSAFTVEEEFYRFSADEQKAVITAGTYVGFVRGLETFSQTVQCNSTRGQLKCLLRNLPITVEDSP